MSSAAETNDFNLGFERIGHLYPKIEITAKMAKQRTDPIRDPT